MSLAWPIALFVIVYLLAGALLCVYGTHAFLMTWLHHRTRRAAAKPAAGRAGPRPFVTVQLPLYNELYVVRRLIDAACRLEYPRDRLEIQVLDDSTDATAAEVAALVAEKQRDGHPIRQIRREGRNGFKGGALREGLARARGELVAIFDADFVPPADFLSRTVPHFNDPRIGMVQARWGHLNADYSLLTRAQAIALDGHLLVEQTARNRNGAFINFNGTAGIWRRRAIEESGNWQDDTLTEDLDLSYRAQLNGWRFVFLPDLVCPAELPVEMNGFKGQQFRWAKGSVQTATKLLPAALRGGGSFFARFQAAIHLTNHAVYPLLLLIGAMSLPALVIHHTVPGSRPLFTWATAFMIGSLGHPLLYVYSQHQIDPRRRDRWKLVPIMIALGTGLAPNNTRAIAEALAGVRSGFNRTPKYDLLRPADRWQEKHYRAPANGLALLELAFGGYLALATAYSALHGQYLVTPFLALYAGGAIWIGSLSMRHAQSRPPLRSPAVVPRGIASAP